MDLKLVISVSAEVLVISRRSTKQDIRHTVWCRYNALSFLKNIHKRHPIACPFGASYEVSFVDPASDWYSAWVPAILYTISYYIGPNYNDIQLHFLQRLSREEPGGWFNVKTYSYQYCGMGEHWMLGNLGHHLFFISIHSGISYTGACKTTYLCWMRSLMSFWKPVVWLITRWILKYSTLLIHTYTWQCNNSTQWTSR